MKKLTMLWVTVLISLCTVAAFATQVRVYVGDIAVTAAEQKNDGMKVLQTLLSSRLNGDKVIVVGSEAEADVVVSGTYVAIGKNFSIDTIAKTPAGKIITRTFVQGTTDDELIPAVGKLADKISAELIKSYSDGQSSGIVQQAAPSAAPLPSPGGNFIKPREQEASVSAGWVSKRLAGAVNLIATGLTLADGSREIFLAGDQQLSYYRQGSDMKLVAEMKLIATEKIISLDTITSSDGNLDIYVTIIRSNELASQVWHVKGDNLVLVAEKLPYFFRSASLAGGAKKLYAQSMGRDTDFYGDVAEATRSGSVVTLKEPIKMPRYGTLYSFNQFRDSDGKVNTLVINPDGYLIVYDQQLKEMWRSNDKFGGSELFFQKEDDANIRLTGDKFRWVFMNQRIQILPKGEILVGKNDGFWVLGNARSYKRGAVYSFSWNGSSLEEKWHTRETENYMSDYQLDETRNELLILQTVQRPSVASHGASSLTIRKVE